MLIKPRLALVLILAGCAQVAEQTTRQQAPRLGIGEQTEQHLNIRYNDTRPNCGNPTQPAFLCNGIEIRGTFYSPNYHVWDNSINSHRKGAVSFSYLRKDSRFNKLAYGYDNGYIFLPTFYAGGRLAPEILCSFPIDADTINRDGNGCGASPPFPGSGPCQAQGITTAAQWSNHYRHGDPDRRRYQCGFDVRDELDADGASAFTASIQARAFIPLDSFATQNELRLAIWPDGQGVNLPLEAFFYINNLPDGRADAQANQRDFKNITGRAVPIISIWLPQTLGGDATFKYLPSDQVIPLGP